jgi:SAM-dependent methyltransferase/uncharacterized protein YbaR (Trm112 family)
MPLPATFESLLACPYDTAPLRRSGNSYLCSRPECRRAFPLVNGVPILINEENSLFSIEDFTDGKTTTVDTRPSLKRRLWSAYSRFVPSLSHNPGAGDNYERFRDSLLKNSDQPVILIVGAGELGEGVGRIISDKRLTFVECDVYLNSRVHAIADGHNLPFLNGSFDGVICQAVLEHVVDPQRCVQEIHRVLKPAGMVYAEVPFMQQVHMGPYDFTRFTLGGFRRLFRDFQEIGAGMLGGPGMALAWSISHFVGSISKSGAWTTFRSGVLPFFIFWIKYLDFFVRSEKAADAASAVYFMGSRSEIPFSDREILRRHWSYRG